MMKLRHGLLVTIVSLVANVACGSEVDSVGTQTQSLSTPPFIYISLIDSEGARNDNGGAGDYLTFEDHETRLERQTVRLMRHS
jgi:hypothetical protein